MKVTKQIEVQNLLVNGQRSIISEAKRFSLTHAEMIERLVERRKRGQYEKLSYIRRYYLQGAFAELTNMLYRENLVFGCWINGNFYSSHNDRDDYYEKQGLSPAIYAKVSEHKVGHYWSHSLKLFFSSVAQPSDTL